VRATFAGRGDESSARMPLQSAEHRSAPLSALCHRERTSKEVALGKGRSDLPALVGRSLPGSTDLFAAIRKLSAMF